MKDTKENKLKLGFADANIYIPKSMEEVKSRGKDYVLWGKDNNFPQSLWEMYLTSSTMQSIVDGICDYTFGNGLIVAQGVPEVVNEDDEEIEDLVKATIYDYILFGGFNTQVRTSKGGTQKFYNALDTRNVRYDEDIEKVYYSKDWGKYRSNALEYDVWKKNTNQTDSVYVYRGSKTRDVYPIPSYVACLNAIDTSIEIQSYHNNGIKNDFNGGVIISFNNGTPDDEEIKQIEKAVNDKFTGTENTNKIMLSFNESKEKSVEITRLDTGDSDTKFEQLTQDTTQNIYAAFRCTSPGLFGIVMDSPLSSQEYTEAFTIFNRTVIKPIQDTLGKQFDKLFGVEASVRFKPFTIEDTIKPEINNNDNE